MKAMMIVMLLGLALNAVAEDDCPYAVLAYNMYRHGLLFAAQEAFDRGDAFSDESGKYVDAYKNGPPVKRDMFVGKVSSMATAYDLGCHMTKMMEDSPVLSGNHRACTALHEAHRDTMDRIGWRVEWCKLEWLKDKT